MAISWLEILVFPGFLFVLGLTFLFEQISSRIYSRFSFQNSTNPLFIPIIDHFRLCLKGEKEELHTRNIIQSIVLVVFLATSLCCALILPIVLTGRLPSLVGDYGPNPGKEEGVIGVISFEGDVFLLFAILVLQGILIFFIYWLSDKYNNSDALKSASFYLLFDIPLFFSFIGPIIAKKSISLSVLAEDIRVITYFNRGFGLGLLVPFGVCIALVSLSFKFDAPNYDRIQSKTLPTEKAPFPENWKKMIWNLSVRITEFVLAGTIVSIFLGGAYIPIPILEENTQLAFTLNFMFKTTLVFLIISLIKIVFPRLKNNQKITLSFKILTPIALVYILIIGIYISTAGIT